MDKSGADNRSNQMNQNNSAYWASRDNSSRPSDWKGNIIPCIYTYNILHSVFLQIATILDQTTVRLKQTIGLHN